MNPTAITSLPTEQATSQQQPQHEEYTPTYIAPEPSPLARPQVPAVIAICHHWGRRTDRTCGQWACYLEWGC